MRGYYCKQKGCQKWDSAMAALSYFLAYRTLLTRMMISICCADGGQKAARDHARRPQAPALPQPQRTDDEPGHSQDEYHCRTPEGHTITPSARPAGP